MRQSGGDASVDVDQLNFEIGYKVKKVDASAQTLHLSPYRLRFLPTTICDVKLDPSEKSCNLRCKNCCRIISQCILSLVGLSVVVVVWALLGALAFYNTEGPREQRQSETLADIQRKLASELANELNTKDDQISFWPETIHKYFEKHESLFLEAVGAGYGEGGGGNIWTYPGCLLFAVSLLTTLGFGAPVPRTDLGRVTAVVFATVGIPLHFLFIINVGNLLANKLQLLAQRQYLSEIPSTPRPAWLKLFPVLSIIFYYILESTDSSNVMLDESRVQLSLVENETEEQVEINEMGQRFQDMIVTENQKLVSLVEHKSIKEEKHTIDDLLEQVRQTLLEHEEKEVLVNHLDMFKSKRAQAEEEIDRLEKELRSLEVTLSDLIKEEEETLESNDQKKIAFDQALSKYSSVFDFSVDICNESDSTYDANVKFAAEKVNNIPIIITVDKKSGRITNVDMSELLPEDIQRSFKEKYGGIKNVPKLFCAIREFVIKFS